MCPPGVFADADRSAYLSGRSLLRVSPAGVLVSLRRRFTCGSCLYPAVTAVAFYSRTNNDAHRCRLRVGREAARTPTGRVEATWQKRASLCSLLGGGDLRCKRLVGRTGTPCSHFSPGAAPPLSLGCVQPGLTAPPTRRCAQLHAPTAPLPQHSPGLDNKSLLTDGSAGRGRSGVDLA